MKIEVLYVPNCPNHAVALERLREILTVENCQSHISEVLVADTSMAQTLKFLGSPTIRINGHDIEPQEDKTESFGLMCRLYAGGNGAPSHERLQYAIRRARSMEV